MANQKQGNEAQAREHSGHSHGHGGHHHHHDNTYLTSKDKSDPGVRITRVGLYVNLAMAVAKGAGGYVFNSQALTADAVHSLTDLISDFATLATISWSVKPATARFPYGYGKVESLGALAVSGILLSGGLAIGLQAVLALSQQFFPEIAHFLSHIPIFEHGHDHGAPLVDGGIGPNINAAWLAAASILAKEWLYRATMKIATEKRSSVLASNAYHHRVDSLTAFVALFTICASHFLTNAQWLDPVGGLIISGMILQAGWGNTKSALFELADTAMDQDVQEAVQKAAASALEEEVGGQGEVRGVQGYKSGQNFLVEVEVGVPSNLSIQQTTHIEEVLREKVAGSTRGIKRVTFRFVGHDSTEDAFQDQFLASNLEEGEDHAHDGHSHSDGQATGIQRNGSAQKRN